MRSIITVTLLSLAVSTTAAAQGDQAEKSADKRDKIVCKRFVETGSLVKGYRTCKSKAEWERERDNLRTTNTGSSCRAVANGGSCS
jgi:hypothetical protein